MLVELSLMEEQRYHAVTEVISGAPVTEVGVSRQAAHGRLGRYERDD